MCTISLFFFKLSFGEGKCIKKGWFNECGTEMWGSHNVSFQRKMQMQDTDIVIDIDSCRRKG